MQDTLNAKTNLEGKRIAGFTPPQINEFRLCQKLVHLKLKKIST